MHNQVVGGEPFSATGDDKEKFARELAAAYGKFTPELQKHIAGAPLLWAALRYQWPKLSDPERDAYKTKLQSYLKTMAPNYLEEVRPPQTGGHGNGESAAEAMARHQRQHNNYVFLSNMMTMRHVAMMNAIGNIGNSLYTYTYR
ncbi:MAG TPA: hypothetical protein VKU00_26700 [Chthonomonadaceae bacterium]|nr:hypothetical protein [Chthonomonadaceae bacterium]